MKIFHPEEQLKTGSRPLYLAVSVLTAGVFLLGNHVDAAERTLEEVIITAQKQPSLQSETPLSMTVISESGLTDRGIHDSMGLSRLSPNLSMVRPGNHSEVGFLSMRGSSNAAETENHAVGFFVDSVPQTLVDSELLDVARVEILRGPQSTLYGRNSQAGLINIITHDPGPDNELRVNLSTQNHNTHSASLVTGGAVAGDKNSDWSYRVATKWMRSDGDFSHVNSGEDVDRRRGLILRGKLRWNPDNGWDVIAAIDRQRYRDRANSLVALDQLRDDSHKVAADFNGAARVNVNRYTLNARYDFDSLVFHSITSIADEDIPAENDVDFTQADIYRLYTDTRVRRQTQEFRLSSPQEKALNWLVGLYLYNQKYHGDYDFEGRPDSGFTFLQSVRSTVNTRNAALFGQIKWPVSDNLSLTTGLRYDYEKQDIDRTEFYTPAFFPSDSGRDEQSVNDWLPKIGLEYHWQSWLFFASAARGYKAGGYNSTAPVNQENYAPEYSNNFEIGARFSSADKTLSADMSVYWIDWTDQQIEVQAFPTGSITTNAGNSHSRGVEFESQWLASEHLLIQLGMGYNRTEFDRYIDPLAGVDHRGNCPPNAPRYTYSLSGDYQLNEIFSTRVDWQVRGDSYYDSANSQKESSYGLLNISLRAQWHDYTVRLWLDNALDEVYATRAFESGGVWIGRAGQPRTFGLSISGHFSGHIACDFLV